MADNEESRLARLQAQRLKEKLKKKIKKKKEAVKTGGGIGIVEGILILVLAMINDAIDILEVSGILKILTLIIDVGTVIILWLWTMWRLHRFPTKRFMGTTVVEFIPFIGVLPGWTIFIISILIKDKIKK